MISPTTTLPGTEKTETRKKKRKSWGQLEGHSAGMCCALLLSEMVIGRASRGSNIFPDILAMTHQRPTKRRASPTEGSVLDHGLGEPASSDLPLRHGPDLLHQLEPLCGRWFEIIFSAQSNFAGNLPFYGYPGGRSSLLLSIYQERRLNTLSLIMRPPNTRPPTLTSRPAILQ